MNLRKYSIPTEYKGIKFRSRLESQWARWFDDHAIKWEYEPEGYELPWKGSTIKYLPDFYLPEMDSFFEVKGVMEELDKEKLFALGITVGKEKKDGLDRVFIGGPKVGVDLASVDCEGSKGFENLGLLRCEKCHKYFFINSPGSCKCLCCGYENKEKTFQEIESAFFSSDYFQVLNGAPIEETKVEETEKVSAFLLKTRDLFRVALYHPELKARAIELLGRQTSEYGEHIQNLLHIIEEFEPSQVRQAIEDSDIFPPKVAAVFIEQLDELHDFGLEIAKKIMESSEEFHARCDAKQEIEKIDGLLLTIDNEEEKVALLIKRMELRKSLRRDRRRVTE